ncbi:MAG: methyltransferase domain-containing protein [bacterium]|nr:methyltransferase domain-containing protein [bacterium]
MNQPDQSPFTPGSVLTTTASVARKTALTIPELVQELEAAVFEHGDLTRAERDGRLLGTLWAKLESAIDVHPNRFSRQKERHLYHALSQHPAWSLEKAQGATFVDFGCGGLNPLSGLLVLKAIGAARCIGIELDPLQETLAVRALARTALELIGEPRLFLLPDSIGGEQVRRNLAGLDIQGLLEGARSGRLATLGTFPVEYRNVSADATGLDDRSVDCVTSFSFYEHVPDVDAIFAEMARITKPGAIGYHIIDGVDHRSYGDASIGPHAFLAVETEDLLVHGSNRIRPLDFTARFERHGFEVLDCTVGTTRPVTEQQRSEMVEPFRSMPLDHLGAVGVRFSVVRR